MTYWIQIGGSGGTADYYGRVDGARYEIVPHDGSYQDIVDAIRWAIAQPTANGKPNMIVLDSMTSLWDLLSDEQAIYARQRALRKAQDNRRRPPGLDEPVVVDADLWSRAKERWGEVLWLLRRHSGPCLLIARQEIVTAFENDKPTRDTTRKIKAEKNLPSAVDAVVELHALGEAFVTGVRTLHWDIEPGETRRFENFSVDVLLRRLGFEEAVTARSASEVRPAAYLTEQEPAVPQPQPDDAPRLTGVDAAALIRRAVQDENPKDALEAVRTEWGTRTLAAIETRTKWGRMSAADLITKSLEYAEERAKETGQQEDHEDAGKTVGPGVGQPPGQDAHGSVGPRSQAPTGPASAVPEPTEEEGAPPPPDPQADGRPPEGEIPEDLSEAEESQTRPSAAAAGRRRTRNEERAYKTLMDEANIQARLLSLTVGEHLGPISAEGDPELTTLRDYLQRRRPKVIKGLGEAGQQELAEAYRTARIPDVSLPKTFAAYFAELPDMTGGAGGRAPNPDVAA
ncbi:hypothetical protein ACIO3O_37205 [Streptomyces sp. NPDC087440]|uniref:hypothetical protein n=1 Tax=Streptomyces sp. NPDC087440 TaxID=3365790 RepID=UPI0038159C91